MCLLRVCCCVCYPNARAFKSNGFWLNAGKKDVLHLSETKINDTNPVNIKNTFDHMAFTAEDKEKYIKILKEREIELLTQSARNRN